MSPTDITKVITIPPIRIVLRRSTARVESHTINATTTANTNPAVDCPTPTIPSSVWAIIEPPAEI
ncbi:hypothetical protein D3C78_1668740 [compost metagenome]